MTKKYNYKNQNGAISAFVMISMLFFLTTIIGVYMIASKRSQTQIQSANILKEQYYSKDEENDLYSEKIALENEIIPLYTKEQLWCIGKEISIEIDGKIYDFSSTDLEKYNLKNDIIINLPDENVNDENLKNYSGLEKEYKVYYFYNNEYYTYLENGSVNIGTYGHNFELSTLSDKLGYVTNGLVVHYDGIMNKSFGHNNAQTVWKDLSGNGNDGNLNGCTWSENNLSFDGNDDWVSIKALNYENITLEAIVEYDNYSTTTESSILSNLENGGYALSTYGNSSVTDKNKNTFTVNIDGSYYYAGSNSNIEINKMYKLTGIYDQQIIKFWENGINTINEKTGKITASNANTIMVLGANPYISNATSSYFQGKIYSIRIYNRALTEEEITKNYEIDKLRFGIE